MSDSTFGLEDWEVQFVQQWARQAERRDGNLPDPEDFDLYYDGPDEDEEDE